MVAFQYEALKITDRSKVNGVINAANEREARELLRDQDLIPSKVKIISAQDNRVQTKDGRINPISALIQWMGNVGQKEKIAFSRNLQMMVKAGIPLTEALVYLEQYAMNAKFKAVVSQVRKDILSGYSFHQSLAKHRNIFSDVYINVARAGEVSGELEAALGRLTDLMVKSEALKMKIISASAYPVIVLFIVGIVLLILFLLVLPTFQEIYRKMGVHVPWITQMMIDISFLMRNYWFIIFPMAGGSIWGMFQYINSSGGKEVMDRVVLKIPILGELMKFINNSHFISTLSVAFSAGLPITEALSLATQTVRNSLIRSALQNVNIQIQAGQRLAVALSKSGYVPDLVLLMVSTGEESGELDKMLENAFEYLEQEINHRIDILMSMMEPIMLIFIGLVVGTIALSIYLPLFSIYEHL